MKPKKEEVEKQKIPEGFTIDPSLGRKYTDQPYFKEKVDRANEILKKHGIPKELMR